MVEAPVADTMESEDENISTLLCMGFPDIAEIKRALRLAKNDLNEAVAILTNEQVCTITNSDTYIEIFFLFSLSLHMAQCLIYLLMLT